MALILNPTGREIRGWDDFGNGRYHAPRGTRLHEGIDFVCEKGQPVLSPIAGTITRYSKPYASDLRWNGCVIVGKDVSIKLWYMDTFHDLIGKEVEQGQMIGYAQDISEKYNDPIKGKIMKPHVHLQVDAINPEKLME